MKIPVAEIPEEGIDFEVEGDSKWLETFRSPREKEELVRIVEPFKVTLHAYRVKDTVKIKGSSTIKVQMRCSRCNEWFDSQLKVDIDSEFHPISEWESRGKEEVELKSSDMDIEFYSAGMLDIDEVVAEHVFLSLPFYPLCSDDCRGLCPLCGTNLNTAQCKCSVDRPVEEWKKTLAALKEKLKIPDK